MTDQIAGASHRCMQMLFLRSGPSFSGSCEFSAPACRRSRHGSQQRWKRRPVSERWRQTWHQQSTGTGERGVRRPARLAMPASGSGYRGVLPVQILLASPASHLKPGRTASERFWCFPCPVKSLHAQLERGRRNCCQQINHPNVSGSPNVHYF